MASAAPAENLAERTTPAQDLSNKCEANQTLKCCNKIEDKLFGLLNIVLPIGSGCSNINLISLVSPQAQCAGSQKLACCSTGNQAGLVNVGNVCPQIL
ncbi:MAG: hypothetical protein Q9174_001561 [Haloplaca sp. 1 TL-2023]